jgi:hypothetical protein
MLILPNCTNVGLAHERPHLYTFNIHSSHTQSLVILSGKNMHFTHPASPEEEFWQLRRISCIKEKTLIKSTEDIYTPVI